MSVSLQELALFISHAKLFVINKIFIYMYMYMKLL